MYRVAPFVLLLFCCGSTHGQQIIGHRGASHDAPENTLAAFSEAFRQGADGIEGDFYLSSDGQIVCIHDKDTRRTAGKNLQVRDASLAELQALDVGEWKGEQWRGERIVTLEDVVAAIPPGKQLIIELKIGPEIVAPLQRIVEASRLLPEHIILISFNADTIAECERQMPELYTHWLTGYNQQQDGRFAPTIDEVIATLHRCHADGLGSEARSDYFDTNFVRRLRDSGYEQFHVWTVDDPKLAKFYSDLGARWITTNRPGWLKEQLGKMAAE